MAHFTFDEREIEQLYLGCKSHAKDLLRLSKEALAAKLSTPAMAEIADQITRNAHLRLVLNPRAEEEAREAARKRRGDRTDPRQIDIETEIRAVAEPNGKKSGKRAKRMSTVPVVDGMDVVNPEATEIPTEDFVRSQLRRAGVDVSLGIIDLWTSSERESALAWAKLAIANPDLGTPEMPAHVWKAAWIARYDFDPRAATPSAAGVKAEKAAVEGWRDYWLEVGPWGVVEHPAKKRGGPGKWEVRSEAGGRLYTGPDRAKAQRVIIEQNRRTAASTLITEVRDRRMAGDGWTEPRPPKVSDVGAEKVHNAATEAR